MNLPQWMRRFIGKQPGASRADGARSPLFAKPTSDSAAKKWPATFLSERSRNDAVFDPSLRHFSNGFRDPDPLVDGQAVEIAWRSARRLLLHRILRELSTSPIRNALVLRGSVLLEAWLPDLARPARDLDFIAIGTKGRSSEGVPLFQTMAEIIDRVTSTDDFRRLGPISRDEIWTYERSVGVRLAFAWEAPGLPKGTMQIDIAFDEPIDQPPVETSILLQEGDTCAVLAATREMSLAWKLYWLQVDMTPQGKDLYDAVLLAERWPARPDLLAALISRDSNGGWPHEMTADAIMHRIQFVDWENFLLEYPDIQGSVEEWRDRLHTALRKSLGERAT